MLRTMIDKQAGAEVFRVSDEPTSLMAMLYGAFLGLLSGLLLLAMSTASFAGVLATEAAVGLLIVAWVASAWLFSRRTGELVVVFRRACAVGVVEWLVLALWFRVEPAVGALAAEGAAQTAAPAGLVERLAGTPATIGLWICLLGWVLCRALTPPRESVPGDG